MRVPRFLPEKDDFVPNVGQDSTVSSHTVADVNKSKNHDTSNTDPRNPLAHGTQRANIRTPQWRVQKSQGKAPTLTSSSTSSMSPVARSSSSKTNMSPGMRETPLNVRRSYETTEPSFRTKTQDNLLFNENIPPYRAYEMTGLKGRSTRRQKTGNMTGRKGKAGRQQKASAMTDSKNKAGVRQEAYDKAGTRRGKKKRRAISYILTGLAILCFVLGVYFLVLPSIVHKKQDDTAQQLLVKLKEQEEKGHTGEVEITVRAGDVNAPGSFSPEYDVILRPGETLDPNRPTVTEEEISRDTVITIKTDTIMRIPKIDLEIAVAPNVKSSSLWVLPGHYPSSARPGQKGVAAYFGHRMYGKGRHFNRLNEVDKGDIIEIQRKGKIYTYLVDAQRIIDPIEIGKYVFEKTSKEKIALVTCHPIQTTGVPKYRIVVQGHLTDVRNVK